MRSLIIARLVALVICCCCCVCQFALAVKPPPRSKSTGEAPASSKKSPNAQCNWPREFSVRSSAVSSELEALNSVLLPRQQTSPPSRDGFVSSKSVAAKANKKRSNDPARSVQVLSLVSKGKGSCSVGSSKERIDFSTAESACVARSMRLCSSKERPQSPGLLCSFWTATPCKDGRSMILVKSNGQRKCLPASKRQATTISCCAYLSKENTAPLCEKCPSGTFAKPEWTRTATDGTASLCSVTHKRPNFVFIIADDLRFFNFSDTGNDAPALSYASPNVTSSQLFPNLSRLSTGNGVFFTNAHAQMAMCSPSRSSLMTGLRPDTTRQYEIKDRLRGGRVKVTTIAQALKGAGYETVAYGKIFDGRATGGNNNQDFPLSWSERPIGLRSLVWTTDVTESDCGYGDPAFHRRKNNKPFAQCVVESPLAFGTRRSLPDEQLTKHALEKIDKLAASAAKQDAPPFFLALGLLRPHLPFVSPQRHFARFPRDTFPFNRDVSAMRDDIFNKVAYRNDEPATYTGWVRAALGGKEQIYPTPAVHSQFAHGYFAACSFVDEMVGKVVDRVRSHDSLVNNTIFIFLSDHGYHLGDHQFYGKKTVYESATNVPLFLFGPDRFFLRRQQIIDTPVELVDLAPTIYELAGLPSSESSSSAFEGQSLVPLFRAENPASRVKTVALSQFYAFGVLRKVVMSYSMRGDRYRYIAHYDKKKKAVIYQELYDYVRDPMEKSDVKLLPEYAGVLSAFRDLFAIYMADMDAYKLATTSLNATVL